MSTLGRALGFLLSTLLLLGKTLLFVLSLSALWGWYFIGLANCAMLVAGTVDQRKMLVRVLRRQVMLQTGDWYTAAYLVVLSVISVIFNMIFAVLLTLGSYEPPFGHVPIYYR